jgi:hypothetical protein
MRFRPPSIDRRRAAPLGLLAGAALAAPAAAETGADYPQPPGPRIVGDTPTDYPGASRAPVAPAPRAGDPPADDPGMLGAPADSQPANAAPSAHQTGGFDWHSAAIGAAGASLLIVLSLGGVSVLSHRGLRRHDVAAWTGNPNPTGDPDACARAGGATSTSGRQPPAEPKTLRAHPYLGEGASNV